MSQEEITAELLLQAYAAGIFPMAETATDSEIFWVDPDKRGIFPLDRFHISRSLAQKLRQGAFEVAVNRDFEAVVSACADRKETWINAEIMRLYLELHRYGHAHSVEVRQNTQLIGGVYGVTLGAAFFGESMFSRATNGSKIALAFLVDRLQKTGFRLFDTQFITPHLASLGGIEIERAKYREFLSKALQEHGDFLADVPIPTGYEVVQRNTQRS